MQGNVKPGDLVGTKEIADRLGVGYPEVVHNWRRRDLGFPAPIARLSIGYIWSWPEVRTWALESGRQLRQEEQE